MTAQTLPVATLTANVYPSVNHPFRRRQGCSFPGPSFAHKTDAKLVSALPTDFAVAARLILEPQLEIFRQFQYIGGTGLGWLKRRSGLREAQDQAINDAVAIVVDNLTALKRPGTRGASSFFKFIITNIGPPTWASR